MCTQCQQEGGRAESRDVTPVQQDWPQRSAPAMLGCAPRSWEASDLAQWEVTEVQGFVCFFAH